MGSKGLVVAADVLIILAFVLIVVGVATTGWAEFEITTGILGTAVTVTQEFGLFEVCLGDACTSWSDAPDSDAKDAATAASALVLIGLIGAILSAIFMGIYMILTMMDKASGATRYLPLITLVVAVVGGIFAILGSIVFAAEFYGDDTDPDPSYSFFLAIFGGVILIVGGAISFCARQSSQVG